MQVTIKFNPHDIWVGVYWKREFWGWLQLDKTRQRFDYDIYFCLVPCFPIHVKFSVVK